MDKLNLATNEEIEDTNSLQGLPSFSLLGSMQTVGSGNLIKHSTSHESERQISIESNGGIEVIENKDSTKSSNPSAESSNPSTASSDPSAASSKPSTESSNSSAASSDPSTESSNPSAAPADPDRKSETCDIKQQVALPVKDAT